MKSDRAAEGRCFPRMGERGEALRAWVKNQGQVSPAAKGRLFKSRCLSTGPDTGCGKLNINRKAIYVQLGVPSTNNGTEQAEGPDRPLRGRIGPFPDLRQARLRALKGKLNISRLTTCVKFGATQDLKFLPPPLGQRAPGRQVDVFADRML